MNFFRIVVTNENGMVVPPTSAGYNGRSISPSAYNVYGTSIPPQDTSKLSVMHALNQLESSKVSDRRYTHMYNCDSANQDNAPSNDNCGFPFYLQQEEAPNATHTRMKNLEYPNVYKNNKISGKLAIQIPVETRWRMSQRDEPQTPNWKNSTSNVYNWGSAISNTRNTRNENNTNYTSRNGWNNYDVNGDCSDYDYSDCESNEYDSDKENAYDQPDFNQVYQSQLKQVFKTIDQYENDQENIDFQSNSGGYAGAHTYGHDTKQSFDMKQNTRAGHPNSRNLRNINLKNLKHSKNFKNSGNNSKHGNTLRAHKNVNARARARGGVLTTVFELKYNVQPADNHSYSWNACGIAN